MSHGQSGAPPPPHFSHQQPSSIDSLPMNFSSSSASPSSSSPATQSTGNTPATVFNEPVFQLPSNGSFPSNDGSKPGPPPGNVTSGASKDASSREPTVPSACLACREKHLKCDGQNPCSRCQSSSFQCVYIASRRGYKGPRRNTTQGSNPNKRHAVEPPDAGNDCPMLLGAGVGLQSGASTITPINAQTDPSGAFSGHPSQQRASNGVTDAQLFRSYCDVTDISPSSLIPAAHGSSLAASVPVATLEDRCLDSFYTYFHGAHPFILPRPFFQHMVKDDSVAPLVAAMQWVGSLFIDAGSARNSLFNKAHRLVHDPSRPRDGFLAQAMMVLIVGLDGSCHQDKAKDLLLEAESLALEIHLNSRSFAELHGKGIPVFQESWRRTWWDLYIIDAMIAGTHQVTNFALFDYPSDVALPCEEHQFLSGDIPIPLSLEDLEDQDFTGVDQEFSSFAYRILCGRNLGRIMRASPITSADDEKLTRLETLLTNWRLHLPKSKRDALDKDGRTDEMMFQAHMMINATSIILHQPHSQLDSSAAREIESCAPHRPVASGDLFNAHTRHTIASASEISKMITYRMPLLSHTHFFTCVVTLSSIVHLSRWSLQFIPHDDDDLRQQIRLNIGALNTLSEVWGAAGRARGQVKGVAQEIYQVKKQQQMNPQFWLGFTQQEMMSSVATDDSIIHEIENLQPLPHTLPEHLIG